MKNKAAGFAENLGNVIFSFFGAINIFPECSRFHSRIWLLSCPGKNITTFVFVVTDSCFV
jgi:hypothetical protein